MGIHACLCYRNWTTIEQVESFITSLASNRTQATLEIANTDVSMAPTIKTEVFSLGPALGVAEGKVSCTIRMW